MPEGNTASPEASAVARPVIRHGTPQRGGIFVPPLDPAFEAGRFGRMLPELGTPLEVGDDAIRALGAAMAEGDGNTSGDNPNIAAGFTYLGQFVDHDITLDTTSIGERILDVTQVLNFRTPRLDLDCVYGLGPGASPQLYARSKGGLPPGSSPLMLLGRTQKGGGDPSLKPSLPFDLPRGAEGRALLGDHRNDENLLVAQTHLAFLRLHNAVAARMPGADFAAVRQQVTWHYQWMVLRDLVGKLVDVNDLSSALRRREFYRFETQSRFGEPFIPVEFSVAAYRLGHSMVRADYSHNRVFNSDDGGIPANNFDFFFAFTGLSGNIVGELAPTPEQEQANPGKMANGEDPPSPGKPISRTLPSDWIVDWRRFFDFGTDPKGRDGTARNRARLIDPYLVADLHSLPGGDPNSDPSRHPSLAVRNLSRGVKMLLPSGQDVANLMGVPRLSPGEIADSGRDGSVAKAHGLHERTPLWYYILKEAQVRQQGLRLGPVGSRIVAEVFVGLLQGDPGSFIGKNPGWTIEKPTWEPTLMESGNGFAMTDLLRVASGSAGPTEDTKLSPVDLPENQGEL